MLKKSSIGIPEVDESGAGNSPIALLSSPGTKQFALLNTTPTPPPCGPVHFSYPFAGSNATLGNTSMTVTLQNFPLTGPLVLLFAMGVGIQFNIYCFVSAVTDSLGNTWTALQPATPWMTSTNSPGDVASYQLYGFAFPGGIPANMQINVTFNLPLTGIANISQSIICLTNCVAFDQIAFHQTTGPGLHGTVNGASITTVNSDIIVSISNIIDFHNAPDYFVPTGTTQYLQNGTDPGLAAAIYGPGLFTPIPPQLPGVYNPTWGTDSSPLKQIILNTVSIRTC